MHWMRHQTGIELLRRSIEYGFNMRHIRLNLAKSHPRAIIAVALWNHKLHTSNAANACGSTFPGDRGCVGVLMMALDKRLNIRFMVWLAETALN